MLLFMPPIQLSSRGSCYDATHNTQKHQRLSRDACTQLKLKHFNILGKLTKYRHRKHENRRYSHRNQRDSNRTHDKTSSFKWDTRISQKAQNQLFSRKTKAGEPVNWYFWKQNLFHSSYGTLPRPCRLYAEKKLLPLSPLMLDWIRRVYENLLIRHNYVMIFSSRRSMLTKLHPKRNKTFIVSLSEPLDSSLKDINVHFRAVPIYQHQKSYRTTISVVCTEHCLLDTGAEVNIVCSSPDSLYLT